MGPHRSCCSLEKVVQGCFQSLSLSRFLSLPSTLSLSLSLSLSQNDSIHHRFIHFLLLYYSQTGAAIYFSHIDGFPLLFFFMAGSESFSAHPKRAPWTQSGLRKRTKKKPFQQRSTSAHHNRRCNSSTISSATAMPSLSVSVFFSRDLLMTEYLFFSSWGVKWFLKSGSRASVA